MPAISEAIGRLRVPHCSANTGSRGLRGRRLHHPERLRDDLGPVGQRDQNHERYHVGIEPFDHQVRSCAVFSWWRAISPLPTSASAARAHAHVHAHAQAYSRFQTLHYRSGKTFTIYSDDDHFMSGGSNTYGQWYLESGADVTFSGLTFKSSRYAPRKRINAATAALPPPPPPLLLPPTPTAAGSVLI